MDAKQVVLPRKLATKANSRTTASATDKGQEITRESPLFLNKKIRDLRTANKVIEAVRALAKVDGTVSTAVYSYVQVANSGYKVSAYGVQDHQFNEEGTRLAQSIMAGMDTLSDYSVGYADKQTVNSQVETALREVILSGTLAGELVLNKARLPDRINLIPAETLKWISRGDGTKFPAQTSSKDDILLNIPNFWVAESHKDTSAPYANSMMEAALTNAYYYAEFIEDMRRVQRRGGHSRLIVTLDAEKVAAAATQEVRSDPDLLRKFMESVRTDVEDVVKAMEPEDALIAYDSVHTELLSSENFKAEYSDLVTAISGMLATSLKSHPSILGLRMGGSQSLSNTESLIFLKNAKAIQRPVEDVFSRALTLAARLFGADIYVKFEFLPINLRPEDELEAFKTMKQQRVLELLSFGFITDEEAAQQMGTGPRSPTAPPLSGTLFELKNNRANEASPNADPQGRALQPDSPSKAGGDSQ